MSPRSRFFFLINRKPLLLNLADLDVPEGHHVAVILQAKVPRRRLTKILKGAELGSGNALVPVV